MESLIILILKCLLLGIIWAALLIPVIFNRGGWLKSMAVFDKESKIKSKVISFACVMSAAAYLISTWVYFDIL